jgi:hypothetical protein
VLRGIAVSPKRAEKTQREKFEAAAREVETDDREEAFDAIVKKIAKAPPPRDDKPPTKKPIRSAGS